MKRTQACCPRQAQRLHMARLERQRVITDPGDVRGLCTACFRAMRAKRKQHTLASALALVELHAQQDPDKALRLVAWAIRREAINP